MLSVDCYVYITVDQRVVAPLFSQRNSVWHSDSYGQLPNELQQGFTDSVYLASNSIPTEFSTGPIPFGDVNPHDRFAVRDHIEKSAKENFMGLSRVLGSVLLVVGVVCLVFGLNVSYTVVERLAEITTGRYTQLTMWYIIGGIAMTIGGFALYTTGRSR